MAAAAETPQLSQEIRDRILSKEDDPLLIPGIGVLLDPEYIAPAGREKAQADLMRGNPYFVVIAGRRYYGESPEQAVENAKKITAEKGINARTKGSSAKGAATTDANGTVRAAPSSGFMGRTWNATKRAAGAAGRGLAAAGRGTRNAARGAAQRVSTFAGRVRRGTPKGQELAQEGESLLTPEEQVEGGTKAAADAAKPSAFSRIGTGIAGAAGAVGRGFRGMTQKLGRGRGAAPPGTPPAAAPPGTPPAAAPPGTPPAAPPAAPPAPRPKGPSMRNRLAAVTRGATAFGRRSNPQQSEKIPLTSDMAGGGRRRRTRRLPRSTPAY